MGINSDVLKIKAATESPTSGAHMPNPPEPPPRRSCWFTITPSLPKRRRAERPCRSARLARPVRSACSDRSLAYPSSIASARQS